MLSQGNLTGFLFVNEAMDVNVVDNEYSNFKENM